jgi:hypothetical protein
MNKELDIQLLGEVSGGIPTPPGPGSPHEDAEAQKRRLREKLEAAERRRQAMNERNLDLLERSNKRLQNTR